MNDICPVLLLDRIQGVSLNNGILRVECIAGGPDGKEIRSGILVIPASQAGNVIQGLVTTLQELEKQVKERVAAAGTPPAGGHA
jgi:hypothetical protein